VHWWLLVHSSQDGQIYQVKTKFTMKGKHVFEITAQHVNDQVISASYKEAIMSWAPCKLQT
jgi:hypothetical protein